MVLSNCSAIASKKSWVFKNIPSLTLLMPPCTAAAKSLVIFPDSTHSTQAFSKVFANFSTSGVPSSFPLCASPLVHANIDAIGLVEVCWPFWCNLDKNTMELNSVFVLELFELKCDFTQTLNVIKVRPLYISHWKIGT